jgi:predicted ABC-type ATPase
MYFVNGTTLRQKRQAHGIETGSIHFSRNPTSARLNPCRPHRQSQLKGYRVSLFFLTLPNVETAIARVAERVRQGGHNIPEPVIRRRFYSGWRNFTNAYRAAVDDWAVNDNSDNMPVLVEWGEAQ